MINLFLGILSVTNLDSQSENTKQNKDQHLGNKTAFKNLL